MSARRATALLLLCSGLFCLGNGVQELTAQNSVNVTTAKQDIPAVCTGCVYRTGQNLQESTLTFPLNDNNFGQYCYYPLDGQVYGQPLVVTNVKIGNNTYGVVVYVVTMNGTVYAFDGQPPVPASWPAGVCQHAPSPDLAGPIAYTSVLPQGTAPPNCDQLGGKSCQAVAPNVGILGTPVIATVPGSNPTTGSMYVVTESYNSGTQTYAHTLAVLDITSLQITTSLTITPPNVSSCPIGFLTPFSKWHIQRPALLLGGDGYLYVPLGMMDGTPAPHSNGMVLAYNTGNLSSAPFCATTSLGQTGQDGAGIWGGGGGLTYGTDANTASNGQYYTFFNTANGDYDPPTGNWADSFIKMYNTQNVNTGLTFNVSSTFTPSDQWIRNNSCSGYGGDADLDFGSGNTMLIPDGENVTNQFLSASGDKEGGIWFIDRTNPPGPNGYGGTSGCATPVGNDSMVQSFAINGSGSFGPVNPGPLIHTNPAYWENYENLSPSAGYIFMGSSKEGFANAPGAGYLMRYQICASGQPINNTVTGCNTNGAHAYDPEQSTRIPLGCQSDDICGQPK